jgi:hypothetical protein
MVRLAADQIATLTASADRLALDPMTTQLPFPDTAAPEQIEALRRQRDEAATSGDHAKALQLNDTIRSLNATQIENMRRVSETGFMSYDMHEVDEAEKFEHYFPG